MVTSSTTPLLIDVALNGSTPKSRNPHVPRSPAEVAADAIACLDAGAALVHTHTDDTATGSNRIHDPEPYREAWRAVIAERPDAILYPTMAVGGGAATIEQRYSHVVALAEDGLLGLGTMDAGSLNLGGADEEGLPRDIDAVYQNSFHDIRYMMDTCARLGVGLSASIFEPGFLRTVPAFHHAGRLPQGTAVKLYFGAREPVSFGLPPTMPSLQAYVAMLEGTTVPWFVSAIGGDVVRCGLARLAIERGGHVQVGLEPYAGDRTPTNAELVREVAALAEDVGRPVGSAAEARRVLNIPGR